MKKLEDTISDEKAKENKDFLRCDHKECRNYGKTPLCYFHIYYNCYMYMKDRIKFDRKV